MKKLISLIKFPLISDDRGSLVSIEARKALPFEIKRVYYLFGTKPGFARGFHAHKSLKQLAVCVNGSCRIVLDNGFNKEDIFLNSPTTGLIIEDMVWREIYEFSVDCVLMVLASEHYDENDYIRNYNDFLRLVKKSW